MRHMSSLAAVCCIAAVAPVLCQTPSQAPYKVLDQWHIGGDGGWDYMLVDSPAHRLYIAHNSTVEVISTETGKSVGVVRGLKSTHGVALDPDGQRGYISDGAGNAVIVFDRKTFAVIATVAAGTNPDAIIYEPRTRTVWAFNGRSNNATVIDPEKRAVVDTLPLPGKPEFSQVDGKGTIYVNIEDRNSIVRLNAVTRKLEATWSLPGCDSPSGLSLDMKMNRLFSVCDGEKMAVTDAQTGKQIALAEIGKGPDAAGYDDKDQLAFSSNGGSGTLSVIDAAHEYRVLQTLATKVGARTLAYDPMTNRIYLATADFGSPVAGARRPPILPNTFTVLVVGK